MAGATPGHLRLPVRLAGGIGSFADPRRAAQLGISPGYPSTRAGLSAVQESLNPAPGGSSLRGAEELVRTLVTLPTHSLVTPSDREEILDLIGSCSS